MNVFSDNDERSYLIREDGIYETDEIFNFAGDLEKEIQGAWL
jgi:hypothetical protein